jgi:hypothetical protein
MDKCQKSYAVGSNRLKGEEDLADFERFNSLAGEANKGSDFITL